MAARRWTREAVTSSDAFGATSSIKEEEGDYRKRCACLLLFLDGRGAPDEVRGGAGEDDGRYARVK